MAYRRTHSYHPQHDALMENEPWLFLEATGQATRHWVQWSIEHARKENYSLILEGVFRDPEMPHATARALASSHTAEVVGLAVREEVSHLAGECRFLDDGRWTPPELHDLSYRTMPETIRVMAGSPAVRRVTITDRTGDDLYVLDKTPGHTAVDPERSRNSPRCHQVAAPLAGRCPGLDDPPTRHRDHLCGASRHRRHLTPRPRTYHPR